MGRELGSRRCSGPAADSFEPLAEFHLGAMHLVAPNPDLATFGMSLGVVLVVLELQFALQLAVGPPSRNIERAGVQCFENGAAGFAVMTAVMEAALLGERLDVGKGGGHAVPGFPEAQFTHAGRIEY